ncbi:hypothetical protein [Sphingomonas sp.]|uniref:hypothetical protein n=1 Tax=Sphingomonas sp. TaxID=28214 RepID=UPI0025E62839|nr:hypothetical protein [Sphingomonas sp.]
MKTRSAPICEPSICPPSIAIGAALTAAGAKQAVKMSQTRAKRFFMVHLYPKLERSRVMISICERHGEFPCRSNDENLWIERIGWMTGRTAVANRKSCKPMTLP